MKVKSVSGQVVNAKDMKGSRINDMVLVGTDKYVGEIIRLNSDIATILCYDEVKMLKVGDLVENTGEQMHAILGPGLIGNIFDGLQRPLKSMSQFLSGAGMISRLDERKEWKVVNSRKGDVKKGEIIAEVNESLSVVNKILAPCEGICDIKEGDYKINDCIGKVGSMEVKLSFPHPLHKSFDYREKHVPSETLVTGQRVLDSMFPVAKGGAGAIPGGFGTGKTVLTQSIAKFSDVDIIVMTLVGERGNECADVLKSFAELKDPKSGRSIMEKSVIIANTSNMPVSARIASIYLGATIGEYYRSMGYDVLMIADSTSRWAEALREVSGSLEEMPGEEGFPVYLASSVASFYGRAGFVETLGCGEGSLSILGAVSPPGGDFSEPVVQATKSVVRAFWGLNPELAYHRHYPAVDWFLSYTNYEIEEDHHLSDMRLVIKKMLEKDEEIQSTVRLVGYESLTDTDKFILRFAEIFKRDFLQQSAMHEIDRFTTEKKQKSMLEVFVTYYESGIIALKHGDALNSILDADLINLISSMKFYEKDEFPDIIAMIEKKVLNENEPLSFEELEERYEDENK